MSFFGLTALGSGNQFVNNKTPTVSTLEEVADDAWAAAFESYALTGNPELAADLRVDDAANTVCRADLVAIARKVLGGRELEKSEAAAFTKTFNIDSSGLIGRAEFFKAIEALRVLCMNPRELLNYKSHKQMLDDRTRHRRIDQTLMECFDKPLTGNAEYGWHAKQVKTSAGDVGAPKSVGQKQTDVTLNEGRSLKDYYGFQ